MLYDPLNYDRTDVCERIVVNKTSEPVGDICHYWYFLDKVWCINDVYEPCGYCYSKHSQWWLSFYISLVKLKL